jgi:hypothetical protein
MTYLRSYVTGNNDAILNDVGRITAVSLVGHITDQRVRRDTALGYLLMVPLSNVVLGSGSV